MTLKPYADSSRFTAARAVCRLVAKPGKGMRLRSISEFDVVRVWLLLASPWALSCGSQDTVEPHSYDQVLRLFSCCSALSLSARYEEPPIRVMTLERRRAVSVSLEAEHFGTTSPIYQVTTVIEVMPCE